MGAAKRNKYAQRIAGREDRLKPMRAVISLQVYSKGLESLTTLCRWMVT
ncbi:hypothetical protein PO124_24250 [Bacillus licheniformis]|nr:hypothetical protein [Bacillus licheniformis]